MKAAVRPVRTRGWRVAALVSVAALLAACQGETVSRGDPNRGNRPIAQAVLEELNVKGMTRTSPVLMRIFKEEAELEVWKRDATGRYALFKTYRSATIPATRAEGPRGRPPVARGLLPDQHGPDEPAVVLLPRVQHGLPEPVRPLLRPHRLAPHGARRLLVARLLRHDGRGHRRGLCAGPRGAAGRAGLVPGTGLSVPHDAAEPRPPPQQPEHGLLAEPERGLRPFRGHPAGAAGRRLRAPLRVQRRVAAIGAGAGRRVRDP